MTTCPYHRSLRKVIQEEIALAGGAGGGVTPAQLQAAVAAEVAAQLPVAVIAAVQAQLAIDLQPAVQSAVGAAVPPAVVAEVTAQLAAQLAPAVALEVAAQVGPEVTSQLNAQLPAAVMAEVSSYLTTNLPALLTAEVASQLPTVLQLQLAPLLPTEVASQLPAVVAAQLGAEVATQLPAEVATQIAAALPAEVAAQLPPLVSTEVSGLLPAEVTTQLTALLPAELAAQLAVALPAEVTAQLATALPPAVTAEVMAQLPGAVVAQLAPELAAQLPAALTAELAAQLPAELASQLTAALPPLVAAEVAALLPAEVASQLPPLVTAEVATQLAAQLPAAVAAEVAASLPAEVSSQLASTLGPAVTAEVTAQLPAAVSAEVSTQIAAALPGAVSAEVALQLANAIADLCLPTVIDDITDFPAAVGGIITLDPQTVYKICGTINLGSSKLRGSDITIIGAEDGSGALISSALVATVEQDGTGTRLYLENLSITNTGPFVASVAVNTTGAADSVATVRNCVIRGDGSFGISVQNVDELYVRGCRLYSGAGMFLRETINTALIESCLFEPSATATAHTPITTTAVAVFTDVAISDCIFRPTAAQNAINAETSATYARPWAITGNVFAGPGDVAGDGTTFFTESAPQFAFRSNVGVGDNKAFGSIFFAFNPAVTNMTGAFDLIGNGATGHAPFVEQGEQVQFALTGGPGVTTQRLTYQGLESARCRVECTLAMEQLASNRQPYVVRIMKNGTQLPQLACFIEGITLLVSQSFGAVTTLEPGDELSVTVEQVSGVDIRINSCHLSAFAID